MRGEMKPFTTKTADVTERPSSISDYIGIATGIYELDKF
jgi:hypothetical protein